MTASPPSWYTRAYALIAQIVDWGDPDLERKVPRRVRRIFSIFVTNATGTGPLKIAARNCKLAEARMSFYDAFLHWLAQEIATIVY